MGHWAALLGTPRTDEQLAAARADVAALFDIEKFTCDDCPAKTGGSASNDLHCDRRPLGL